ncbi:MAG: hypothetical protein KKC77_19345 [Proteobacteria bacterium]|nr:hypothetical protein [Pseudomonadota bacterium]
MVENPGRVIKHITWEEFGSLIDKLVKKISSDKITGVYGVPNNGVIVAGVLAKKLGVKHLLTDDDIEFSTLIVDDISDSGETLMHIKMRYITNETATLHIRNTSKYRPNYFVEEINEEWIQYPFER